MIKEQFQQLWPPGHNIVYGIKVVFHGATKVSLKKKFSNNNNNNDECMCAANLAPQSVCARIFGTQAFNWLENSWVESR